MLWNLNGPIINLISLIMFCKTARAYKQIYKQIFSQCFVEFSKSCKEITVFICLSFNRYHDVRGWQGRDFVRKSFSFKYNFFMSVLYSQSWSNNIPVLNTLLRWLIYFIFRISVHKKLFSVHKCSLSVNIFLLVHKYNWSVRSIVFSTKIEFVSAQKFSQSTKIAGAQTLLQCTKVASVYKSKLPVYKSYLNAQI